MNEPKKRSNYLLVIGINDYPGGQYTKLKNPIFDCNKIANLLIEQYGFEHIHPPIYNEQATRKKIIDELSSLKFSTTKEDNLIIYFAGHGSMNPHTKRGYWVPVDATGSDSELIPYSTIKDKIEDIECKHVLLISDACFSGTFLTQTRSTSTPRAFAEADKLKSRWYFSSGREEPVNDGLDASGSPFCNSLSTVLENNESKYLMVSELISRVTILTSSKTAHTPIGGPIFILGHEMGELIFTRIDSTDILSGDQLNFLMQTYGFYVGQKLQIDSIKQGFPDLKQAVTILELKWAMEFGSASERITTILSAHYGSNWQTLSDQITKNIGENMVSLDSSEDAESFLIFAEDRLKQSIPSPIYETLILNIPEIATSKPLEFFKGYRRTLHSIDSSKNKGLRFKIEMPISWSRQEGKRPNVLWLLSGNNMEVACVVTVHLISEILKVNANDIKDLGDQTVSEYILSQEYLEKEFAGQIQTKATYIKTILCGEPCAILQFQAEQRNLLTSVETHTRLYSVVYKNYLLMLNFILPKQHEHRYPQFEILFDSIANTLIIENKYV